MAASRSGVCSAWKLHSRCRGKRSHPVAGTLGAERRAERSGAARLEATASGCREPVDAAFRPVDPDDRTADAYETNPVRPETSGTRTHRKRDHASSQTGAAAPEGVSTPGCSSRDRRFRDGIFVSEPDESVSTARAED